MVRDTDGRDGSVSRCQVPYNVYLLHEAVDEALHSGITLLEKLNEEFDAILHTVGCNTDMSALLRDSAACWDWSRLVFHRPSVQQIRAFGNVIKTLRPLLIQTYYPVGEPFGGVSPHWPDDDCLMMQYMKLTQRVRDAAAGARDVPDEVRREALGWVDSNRKFVVRPLWVNRVIEQVCQQHARGRAWTCCLRPAALIPQFAALLPDEAYSVWELPLDQLDLPQRRKIRMRRRGKRKRSFSPVRCKRNFLPGQVCAFVTKNRRALMFVEASKVVVNIAKVAASLDSQSWFHVGRLRGGVSSGGVSPLIAWHAGRVHHRCRLLFPPDTACEGVGSFLRLAWDQRRGMASPIYVSDRAFLMQAGVLCLGGDRDELVVREVCRLLQTTSKYKVSAGGTADKGMAPFARVRDEAFAKSGRFSGSLPVQEAAMVLEPSDLAGLQGQGAEARRSYLRARAKSAKPVELPDVVKQSVSKAISKSQVVQPLPPNIDVMHALQRGATSSVVQQKITTWLDSKEGLEWQKERKELFEGGCEEMP